MKLKKSITYSMIGILVAALIIGYVAVSNLGGTASANQDNVAVQSSVMARLYGIANNYTLAEEIGTGAASNFPIDTNKTPLVSEGKPVIIYIGADYCPFCAATRWGLIIALMRFGNFTSLHYMTSSASDYAPGTPTFTFYNSSYSSPYINFDEVEELTNTYPYKVLQVPNSVENSTFDAFDLNNSIIPPSERGGIPFIDFANVSYQNGAEFSPLLINKYSWNQIIAMLGQPNSTVAQSIIGSANVFTAQICRATNYKPPVCSMGFAK